MLFEAVFNQIFKIWVPVASGVFLLVVAILVVAVIRNRAARREKLPFRAAKNTPLEVTYAVLLAAAAGALIYGSFWANGLLNNGAGLAKAETTKPVARIDVTAYRWCWTFDNEATATVVTGKCAKKGEYPTVVVPAGKPVQFDITSRDVIHSFWMPDFFVKRDAFPNHMNHLRMKFPEEGLFEGRCAEFCGTYHVAMHFYVRVVSPAEYQQYLASSGAA